MTKPYFEPSCDWRRFPTVVYLSIIFVLVLSIVVDEFRIFIKDFMLLLCMCVKFVNGICLFIFKVIYNWN